MNAHVNVRTTMTPLPSGLQLRWIRFGEQTAHVPAYANLLDADERRRAEAFVFDRDRRRFTIARALLRITIAHALDLTPQELAFDYGPWHKPSLAWPPRGRELQFNVSHAGDVAVIVTAWHRPVGVDVECVRADLDHAQLAVRFFSPRERAALAVLAPGVRARAFFDVWTRKEAYVKARGLGLSMPLDSFDVAAAPAATDALLATRPDSGDAARWTVRALAAPPGYAAALASATGTSMPAAS
jgi:4'-phosphopantetheinyl transferase